MPEATTEAARSAILPIRDYMRRSIIGQDNVVDKILITLLADGNLLLESLPGLGKTRSIKALSKVLESKMSRIQFTPDLLPSDITGTEFYQEESEEKFVFQPGPIFGNLILADEINRAPAKVQAALLEAMEERQVSVAGKTYPMEPLFMVMATQNPVEQEGTYPLPEAQMDRFLMKVAISYPTDDSERKILALVKGEHKGADGSNVDVVTQSAVFAAREAVKEIRVSEAVEQYIVDLVSATRHSEKYSDQLSAWIDYGASPRGTISLDRASRAHAFLQGSDFVDPDNVRSVVYEVLRHRLILSYEAAAERITTDNVIDELLKVVAVA